MIDLRRAREAVTALVRPDRVPDTSVPPMDGAFTPNSLIEQGEMLLRRDDLVDALPLEDGRLVVAHGGGIEVVDLETRASTTIPLPGRATALAVSGSTLCVGVAGRGVAWLSLDDLPAGAEVAPGSTELKAVTALGFDGDGRLWVANGSREHSNAEWQRDLLLGGSTGYAGYFADDRSAFQLVADGLAWPAGIACADDGRIVVAESWKHRLVVVGNGPPEILLTDLPGYPGAITVSEGTLLLAVFAPRTRIVDFVMREPDYLRRMLEELEPQAWVAPMLRTTRHPIEQVQGGQLLVVGKIKPWAPSRSFGLLVELAPDWTPVASYHSRSDGTRHGITRGWRQAGLRYAVSAGTGEIICIETKAEQHE